MSEYKKRRAYYRLWRKEMGQESSSDGMTTETYGFVPEDDATIIGA